MDHQHRSQDASSRAAREPGASSNASAGKVLRKRTTPAEVAFVDKGQSPTVGDGAKATGPRSQLNPTNTSQMTEQRRAAGEGVEPGTFLMYLNQLECGFHRSAASLA